MNVIANVPQAGMDDFEMKSEDWFKLAINKIRPQISIPHGNLATNGISLYIVDEPGACDCGNKETHDKINHIIDLMNESAYVLTVNRSRLIDALAGINPDNDAIRLFVNNELKFIAIQDSNKSRTAIIMGLIDISIPSINIKKLEEKEEGSKG